LAIGDWRTANGEAPVSNIPSDRRLELKHCGLLLLLCLASSPLPAQLVRGQVTIASTGAPLGGALVALADSGGTVVARTLSSASGQYAVFAPRAGRWEVRVAAIGYTPERLAGIEVGVVATLVNVALAERPFVLPELVAVSSSECRVDPASGPVVERLLAEATTALGLVEATIASRRLEFITESWRVRLGTALGDTLRQATMSQARASWPIASAAEALLREGGFVHDAGTLTPAIGYTDDSGPIYYGPDLQVLAAPWFVAGHCFDLAGAAGDSLIVRFTPQTRSAKVDISGTLVLDRESLALRRLTFEYVGLPRWVPATGAGGEVTFERLPDGLWVTRAWRLRAPIQELRRVIGAPRGATFGGWVEVGGRVVEIVGGG